MEDKLKKDATLLDSKGRIRGHHAVDPSGHLVLLRPGSNLTDPGWRWATEADHQKAAAVEKARAEAEAKAEADRKAAEQAKAEAEPEKTGGPLQ